MNFVRDALEGLPADGLALIELTREGDRHTHTFGEVIERSARLAGRLSELGVGRGDVVMCVIGSRPEWVYTMLACFRGGMVVLPCNEQLRAKDLRIRIERVQPTVILADKRNRSELEAARPDCPVLLTPDPSLYEAEPLPTVELSPDDPCLIIFTSGTSGEPKGVLHGQRYLFGQRSQTDRWLTPHSGDVVWCTAASGWSKSARNVFIAPWLGGAAALLHDDRFDPEERLAIIEREQVNVLCMAPTEYRVIAKRARLRPLPSLHQMVAAGEALNPEVITVFKQATELEIRDGYGQTETGQVTGPPPGEPARPGSMGKLLPGINGWLEDGELVLDQTTVPTFFLNYLGEQPPTGPWHTGDYVSEDGDGYLYFEGRSDDLIISSGYRIGPFEVESALVSHPAVTEAAVVAAPDEERGSIVRALVVLADGRQQSAELLKELQNHVKAETAPYKYPRVIEFVDSLPKTASGKVKRAELREGAINRYA